MGKKWFFFNPEDHLIYFEPQTLKNALESAGYEVIQIRSVIRYMSLGEIILSFRPYAKRTCDLILKALKIISLDRWVFRFHLGEMEAFARKPESKDKAQGLSEGTAKTMDVLCCPKCVGELEMMFPQVFCKNCTAVYNIEHGVINFSKYSKKPVGDSI